MSGVLIEQVLAAVVQFSSTTRLYELTVSDSKLDLGSCGLLVEAFAADDVVHSVGVGVRDVIAVSTSAYVDMEALLGQPAVLQISLAGARAKVSPARHRHPTPGRRTGNRA